MLNSFTKLLCILTLSLKCIVYAKRFAWSEDINGSETYTDSYKDRDDSDNSTEECYGYKECDSDTVSADFIYCGGYFACYEADMSATKAAYADGLRGAQEADIYSSHDVYCGGYLGCFMAAMWSKGDTICDGILSCWHSDLASDNDIYLLGYRSGGASEIAGNSEDSTLYSYGPYGAIYSVITGVSKIINLGHTGLYYADIDTEDTEELNVYTYGRFGGLYAQIFCRSGSTCNVYCQDFGCYGLEIRCFSGAECSYTLSDSSCDASPTILYSSDDDDDTAFDILFKTRKEAKLLAKQEMARYSRSQFAVNEFEEIFEATMEKTLSKMHLVDGKLPQRARKYARINTELIDMTQSNVVYASEYTEFFETHKHGQEKGLDTNALCAIGGVVTGLLCLLGVQRWFTREKTQTVEPQHGRYQYQSI